MYQKCNSHAAQSERFLYLVSIIPVFGDALFFFKKKVGIADPEMPYYYSLGLLKTA